MTTPHEPRAVCMRCMRPQRVCYCAHLVSLPTRNKVLILQHPREQHMPIGTAHMAHLCLPNSALHVGVQLEDNHAVQALLRDPACPAYLLYPSEDACILQKDQLPAECTLVVLDGTWWQARKLLRQNPCLQALPKLALAPSAPSEYRIRREPQADYLSTIEALACALPQLEGISDGRFEALKRPFYAMIDKQLECERTLPNAHAKQPRVRQKPRKSSLVKLRERARELVCVAVEASAWARPKGCAPLAPLRDEIVYFAAIRLRSDEALRLVRAPDKGLAPHTAQQSGLSAEVLARGLPAAQFAAQVRAFLRPEDALCTWGHHAHRLLRAADLAAECSWFDVRQVARDQAQGKVGEPADVCRALGVDPAQLPALAEGRAGSRLAELVAITRALCSEPLSSGRSSSLAARFRRTPPR